MSIIRAEIKAKAKHAIKQSKPNALLVTLVYLAVSYVLSYFVITATDLNGMLEATLSAAYSADYSNITYNYPSTQATLISLVIGVMDIILAVGFTIFAMNVARLKQASFGNLLDGFGIFIKALWLHILMWIFIFLWSLLLVIPGIIAAYRYSQALYIMLDNPNLTALECIRASREMMKGRKWELFVLNLSFLGWHLLSGLPYAYPIPYASLILALAIGIWVTPYVQITLVNYYDALLGIKAREQRQLHERPTLGYDNRDLGGGEGGKPPWEL